MKPIFLNISLAAFLMVGAGLQAGDMPEQEPPVTPQKEAPTQNEDLAHQIKAEQIRQQSDLVIKGNDELLPGFKKEVFLGEVAPEYQEHILKVLARLMQDFRAVHTKNYTPDVIPGTIRIVLADVLKGKDAQSIAGFMNATHMAGLNYLTNGAASLFVESQLPTTFKQHLFSGIKALFCMPSMHPDEVLEKAADMQIKQDIIDTYIAKQIELYKRAVFVEWSAADEILHSGQGRSLLAKLGMGGTQAYNIWKQVPLEKITMLYGLTTLDGIGLLPDNEKTKEVVVVGLVGLTIPANTFKGLSYIKDLVIIAANVTGRVEVILEDDAFVGLDNLTSLHLHTYNSKKGLTLTKRTLAGLTSLEFLTIENLRTSSIEPGTFDGLKNLLVLKLSNNGLETVDAHAFSGLSQLKNLYLDNNIIHQVEKQAFNGLGNLTLLSLNNNRLNGLSAESFAPLKKLGFLDVRNNPIPLDNLTTLRKKIRKGCYIAYPSEHLWEKGGWSLLPVRSELHRLNEELSVKPVVEEETQK